MRLCQQIYEHNTLPCPPEGIVSIGSFNQCCTPVQISGTSPHRGRRTGPVACCSGLPSHVRSPNTRVPMAGRSLNKSASGRVGPSGRDGPYRGLIPGSVTDPLMSASLTYCQRCNRSFLFPIANPILRKKGLARSKSCEVGRPLGTFDRDPSCRNHRPVNRGLKPFVLITWYGFAVLRTTLLYSRGSAARFETAQTTWARSSIGRAPTS